MINFSRMFDVVVILSLFTHCYVMSCLFCIMFCKLLTLECNNKKRVSTWAALNALNMKFIFFSNFANCELLSAHISLVHDDFPLQMSCNVTCRTHQNRNEENENRELFMDEGSEEKSSDKIYYYELSCGMKFNLLRIFIVLFAAWHE